MHQVGVTSVALGYAQLIIDFWLTGGDEVRLVADVVVGCRHLECWFQGPAPRRSPVEEPPLVRTLVALDPDAVVTESRNVVVLFDDQSVTAWTPELDPLRRSCPRTKSSNSLGRGTLARSADPC